jgi:hypothetical protein
MTREEAKDYLPIIQAFAEGKDIQIRNITDDGWDDINDDRMSFCAKAEAYRIKPESTYRPFKSREECWNEMHNHPDFGWVAAQDSKVIYHINIVGDGYIHIDGSSIIFSTAYSEYEFLDGTPFGIKEE